MLYMALTLFLAEVVDKEPTLFMIWLVACILSICSLALCLSRRWTALIPIVAAAVWATALLSELRDPDVGPAILNELGRAYVIQNYVAALTPFIFAGLGFLPWFRRHLTN